MADMKFSCPHCGQHIACDDAWSGHQIQCPGCQGNLLVPPSQPPSAATAPAPAPRVAPPPEPGGARLAPGATQPQRPAPPHPPLQRPAGLRPPKTGNPVLRFAIVGVLLLAAGWAAWRYVPSLLNSAHDLAGSPPTTSTAAPRGPLGEANAAMDVSDALDGNSAAPPRPAARPPVAAQPPANPPVAVPPRAAASLPPTRNTNTTASALTRRVTQPR